MSQQTLWAVVLLSGAATFLWRGLGVVFAQRIDTGGALFQWVSCVSYAMVAALVCRMIVFPGNELITVDLWVRLTALGAALAGFYLSRQSLPISVLIGFVVFNLLSAV